MIRKRTPFRKFQGQRLNVLIFIRSHIDSSPRDVGHYYPGTRGGHVSDGGRGVLSARRGRSSCLKRRGLSVGGMAWLPGPGVCPSGPLPRVGAVHVLAGQGAVGITGTCPGIT